MARCSFIVWFLALFFVNPSTAFKPRPTCKKSIKSKCFKKRCQKAVSRSIIKPKPHLLFGPLLPVAAPIAGFYGVMSAPIYGKGLIPGTGGMVDFSTLEKRASPNEYLAAPDDSCPQFKGSATSGGGGGGGSRGPSPVFEGIEVEELQDLFLQVIKDLYILQAYAQPTLSDPNKKQFVFVQRTPLLRFPDVINVQFLSASNAVAGKPEDETVSTIIVHSGSVFGFDDLGTNRKRVEDLLARVKDAADAKLKTKKVQEDGSVDVSTPAKSKVDEAEVEEPNLAESTVETPDTADSGDNPTTDEAEVEEPKLPESTADTPDMKDGGDNSTTDEAEVDEPTLPENAAAEALDRTDGGDGDD